MPKLPKTSPSEVHGQPESVRGAFLCAARTLFAEKGFDGVSVKELAQSAGHNAALVSYYFGSKEGLFRECVMPLIGAGLESANATLRTPTCQQDFLTRFELFVEEFLAAHLKQQDVCIILKRDSHTQVVKDIYKEHFVELLDRLQVFLKSAKRVKVLRRDVETELATHMIFSCLFQMITFDRFRIDVGQPPLLDEKHRPATVRQITQLLLRGIIDC